VKEMKPVYGPVPSWRLGKSLGIDPICEIKICSFDCIYCQLGKTTRKTIERDIFVDTKLIKQELRKLPYASKVYDVVTLSGTGEPELAKNLGEIIEIARDVTKLPVAVLTNSSLMYDGNVRKDLSKADIVVAKLDAPNYDLFKKINNPHPNIDFDSMVEGMIKFRDEFHKKYALQMMFIEQNKLYSKQMREIAEKIRPDEVQIDTPFRPCKVPKLNPDELEKVTESFKDMNVISYYKSKKLKIKPMDESETLKRRPK
jgi:wyosine [tRNA(Phe)-imidazoG37] synthetase (radical SAM superfamily)